MLTAPCPRWPWHRQFLAWQWGRAVGPHCGAWQRGRPPVGRAGGVTPDTHASLAPTHSPQSRVAPCAWGSTGASVSHSRTRHQPGPVRTSSTARTTGTGTAGSRGPVPGAAACQLLVPAVASQIPQRGFPRGLGAHQGAPRSATVPGQWASSGVGAELWQGLPGPTAPCRSCCRFAWCLQPRWPWRSRASTSTTRGSAGAAAVPGERR